MTVPHTVKEDDVRCPLDGCQFYSNENGWHRWRGTIDEKVLALSDDMRALKKIGLAVVGAVLLQVFVGIWGLLLK